MCVEDNDDLLKVEDGCLSRKILVERGAGRPVGGFCLFACWRKGAARQERKRKAPSRGSVNAAVTAHWMMRVNPDAGGSNCFKAFG